MHKKIDQLALKQVIQKQLNNGFANVDNKFTNLSYDCFLIISTECFHRSNAGFEKYFNFSAKPFHGFASFLIFVIKDAIQERNSNQDPFSNHKLIHN